MLKNLTERLKSKPVLLAALAFCILMQTADTISSLGFSLAFEEKNPFVRDALHQFVLTKGIIVKLMAFGAFGVISLALWQGFKRYSEMLADFFCSLPFWYWGVAVMDAVVTNMLLKMGYWVP